jgi:hypothetical protein
MPISIVFLVLSVEAQTNGGLVRRTPESIEQTRRLERQVTLDIQVIGASGKPVTSLAQQDMTILDNGQLTADIGDV